MNTQPRSVGTSLTRLDGHAKVTGTATYAYEQPVERPAYLHPVQATIARGGITALDTSEAEELDGVIAVLTHLNAPRLGGTDHELAILQSDEVAFRGQLIGGVIAESPEIARHAAGLVHVRYEQVPHDTELSGLRDDLYAPDRVNPSFATDFEQGEVDAALDSAAVQVDEIYSTPLEHNNPMEPHTCVALWAEFGHPRLTLFDSTQGVYAVRSMLAPVLDLDPTDIRVVSPHVGGGFGSKGMPHAHNVLAALAAQVVAGRAVKLALTRQQMFALAGCRTPTIQHVRLGADADGRLTAIAHEVVEQTSTVKEFAEQSAEPSRHVYAAANRRTGHRLAALDVPVTSWMRAPGECPGSFGPEVAMDELAAACGVDPVELRTRNEPETDPQSGLPWSGRHLAECLREGARLFGWERRGAAPGSQLQGRCRIGLGVASSTYPAQAIPGSHAEIELSAGRYVVRIGAADIGTGTWTTLTQIAADALGCPVEDVQLEIGDTDLPTASVAGGSSGIVSWGSTIVAAAKDFSATYGPHARDGDAVQTAMPDNPDVRQYATRSFGAQFAEVHVNADTGEIRVPRMLGVFSVGRIINPTTARSQFIGGMTMGLSMALHEHSVIDHRTGHVINHDFAQYHIPTHADVQEIDAVWLDEEDTHVSPMGARGIGEIGIVGAAAAIANAAFDATGVRLRSLPITPDRFLGQC